MGEGRDPPTRVVSDQTGWEDGAEAQGRRSQKVRVRHARAATQLFEKGSVSMSTKRGRLTLRRCVTAIQQKVSEKRPQLFGRDALLPR